VYFIEIFEPLIWRKTVANIIVEVYNLTPKTEYDIKWRDSSNPGHIDDHSMTEETDSTGFICFEAPKHSEEIQIKLSGGRVIDLEE
jgi:hypothetical protein